MTSPVLGAQTQNVDITTALIQRLETLKTSDDSDSESLQETVQKQYQEKIQEVEVIYGEWFCNIVGREKIANLPVVDAKQLHLDSQKEKDYSRAVKVEYLKGEAAVRGATGLGQGFIALTIDVRNEEKHLATITEVIYQRHAELKNDYFPLFPHLEDCGEEPLNSQLNIPKFEVDGFLYLRKRMTQTEIEAVRDLLDGKEIKDITGTHWIKKV